MEMCSGVAVALFQRSGDWFDLLMGFWSDIDNALNG